MATESELLRGSDTPITDAWWSSVTTCARDTKQTVDHLREARAGMSLMERELASLRAEKERAERAEAERDAALKDADDRLRKMISNQAAHVRNNANRLEVFVGMQDEARCRRLAASYLEELSVCIDLDAAIAARKGGAMSKAFQVVKDFERAVAEYTGAPYVVAVNSCSMAILLAVAWHIRNVHTFQKAGMHNGPGWKEIMVPLIEIPKRTYVSVPMSIIHAGGRPTFRDEDWVGAYQLKPLPVWDSARYFTSTLYKGLYAQADNMQISRDYSGQMVCTSHHWSKTLGIQQGGCILHDDPEADAWLRRARFDGRTEGVAPKDDTFTQIGWHAYLSPEVAAEGLVRIQHLPRHNAPLPNDDYPDLSTMEIFR